MNVNQNFNFCLKHSNLYHPFQVKFEIFHFNFYSLQKFQKNVFSVELLLKNKHVYTVQMKLQEDPRLYVSVRRRVPMFVLSLNRQISSEAKRLETRWLLIFSMTWCNKDCHSNFQLFLLIEFSGQFFREHGVNLT